MINRRELLRLAGGAAAALGASSFPFAWTAPDPEKKKKLLMFTRSQAFEHSVVKRGKDGELSLAEKIVTELGKKHGFEVTCSKDGRDFLPDNIAKFDAFLFETTGDLTKEGGTDNNPAMPPEGKKAFLDAIAAGKGFVGCHCASDTFHSAGKREENQERDKLDPYIAMLGGEFIVHGAQQTAKMKVTDDSFPGAKGLKDFEKNEEWYALKNFAPDLHVILVQGTEGMKGAMYERPDFPATWARKHEKGRVFYTSMGHREDVWESEVMQNLLAGALSWVYGNVDVDIKPNIDTVAPKSSQLKNS
jgi:type 1 glutamine amidotransferase